MSSPRKRGTKTPACAGVTESAGMTKNWGEDVKKLG